MKEKVIVLDTTLRDGEQALKSSLSVKDKLKIAFSLEEMRVDIIEAGFPVSSPGDFDSIKMISNEIKNSTICSLARCVEKDIDIAAKAMEKANSFRIHVFLGTSYLHVTSKLRKTFDQIVNMAIQGIERAKQHTNDVEFSCEDAGRTSIDNLCKIIEAAIEAGATTINIPDTVGYNIPSEFGSIISHVCKNVPNIKKAIISVHCHNDLGMAVGNTISAIEAGARQIEGTINGIGERAGNTALEEVILAIKMKKKLLNVFTNIKISSIYTTSKLVSSICKVFVPENKAIVGSNAFSHSSGIHQDGVLKNRENYEIINPRQIGISHNKLNLTSRSGRAAVNFYMRKMGYSSKSYDIDKLYSKFLKLADKNGQLFDYDLEILAFLNDKKKINLVSLKSFKISYSYKSLYCSSIELFYGEKLYVLDSIIESNIINIILKAVFMVTKILVFFKECRTTVINKKDTEYVESKVTILYNNRVFYGTNISTNFSKSIFESFIQAFNKILKIKKVYDKLKRY